MDTVRLLLRLVQPVPGLVHLLLGAHRREGLLPRCRFFVFITLRLEIFAYDERDAGVGAGDIDLLLNWGSIIFIPVLPYVVWLQTRPNGLILAFWQVRVPSISHREFSTG